MKTLPGVAVLPGALSFVILPNMTIFGTKDRINRINSVLSSAPNKNGDGSEGSRIRAEDREGRLGPHGGTAQGAREGESEA